MDRMRVRDRRSAWLALIGVISLVACESTTAVAVTQDVATSLSIAVAGGGAVQEPGPLVLEPGEAVALTAVAINPLGLAVPGALVTWSSTNTSVAVVDAMGVVSALGVGSTEIRAEAGEAESSMSVVVNDPDAPGGD